MRGVDAPLTARQREILALMAEGLSNNAIARRLHVSEKTVVQHCSNIYAALDLAPTREEHRRVKAVVRHLRAVETEAVLEVRIREGQDLGPMCSSPAPARLGA
jgi:DNA-binding NarL/FixJ family response regulator